MRVALIALLAACSSPTKKPAEPATHVDSMGSASESPPSTEDRAELEKAKSEAVEARKDADAGMERVERLARALEDLDTKVTEAVDAVVAARNDADRANAKAKLEQLRREKAEMDRRIQDAKARAPRSRRMYGQPVSKECQENPLAKGCI